MIDIFNTVESLYKRNYREESEEFKKGFEICLALFETGIYQSTRYNLSLENNTLKLEVKEKDKVIRFLNKKINKNQDKLKEKVLVDAQPTEVFRHFSLGTIYGDISIVVNMERSTFEFCMINFSRRYSYKSLDECKTKVLQYINSFKARGFAAYKNKEVAIKEGVRL